MLGFRHTCRWTPPFSRTFTLPFFDKKARAGVILFNVTNHFNPRNVQNNLNSLNLGQFYNSLGTPVRGSLSWTSSLYDFS